MSLSKLCLCSFASPTSLSRPCNHPGFAPHGPHPLILSAVFRVLAIPDILIGCVSVLVVPVTLSLNELLLLSYISHLPLRTLWLSWVYPARDPPISSTSSRWTPPPSGSQSRGSALTCILLPRRQLTKQTPALRRKCTRLSSWTSCSQRCKKSTRLLLWHLKSAWCSWGE